MDQHDKEARELLKLGGEAAWKAYEAKTPNLSERGIRRVDQHIGFREAWDLLAPLLTAEVNRAAIADVRLQILDDYRKMLEGEGNVPWPAEVVASDLDFALHTIPEDLGDLEETLIDYALTILSDSPEPKSPADDYWANAAKVEDPFTPELSEAMDVSHLPDDHHALAVLAAYTEDEYLRTYGTLTGSAQAVASAIIAAGFSRSEGDEPARSEEKNAKPSSNDLEDLLTELQVSNFFTRGKRNGDYVPLADFTRERIGDALNRAMWVLSPETFRDGGFYEPDLTYPSKVTLPNRQTYDVKVNFLESGAIGSFVLLDELGEIAFASEVHSGSYLSADEIIDLVEAEATRQDEDLPSISPELREKLHSVIKDSQDVYRASRSEPLYGPEDLGPLS